MLSKIPPQIVFENSSAYESNDLKLVNSLPCRINYTGPASVKSYFLSETFRGSDKKVYAATFRGRIVFGHKPILPKLYKFYVAKRLRKNVLNQQIFQLSCNCNLRLWDFDLHACTNQESSIQRSIDFLKIAEDLAQPDKI